MTYERAWRGSRDLIKFQLQYSYGAKTLLKSQSQIELFASHLYPDKMPLGLVAAQFDESVDLPPSFYLDSISMEALFY